MDLERLKRTLKAHEGTGKVIKGRFFPYKCPSGKLTIGYGRNIEDVGISEIEAEFMLENDINAAIQLCKIMFFNFDMIDNVRQEVLVNMMFNMGYSTFSQFKKFKAAVEAENWNVAAKEMENSKWFKQVGQRARDLKSAILTGQNT